MAKKPARVATTAIASIVGFLALCILVQAVTGGDIAKEPQKSGLVHFHQGVGYLVAVLAVATVVIALTMWWKKAGGQVVVAESVALLVLVIIQVAIGQQIHKSKHPGALLAIHVPIALLIFGIALHMSTFVATMRRGA
jgi:heme A synthase